MRPLFTMLLTATMLVGCPSQPNHPEVPADCNSVCAHIGPKSEQTPDALDCELGRPTEKGGKCTEVCTNSDDNGFPWPVGCMLSATTCEQVEACE